jgi:hypothetical protein
LVLFLSMNTNDYVNASAGFISDFCMASFLLFSFL